MQRGTEAHIRVSPAPPDATLSPTGGYIAVFGDLHLDVRGRAPLQPPLRDSLFSVPHGRDHALAVPLGVELGGSALTFATTLATRSEFKPFVFGSVSSGLGGQLITDAMASLGLESSLQGSERDQSVVVSINDTDGRRLMLRPTGSPNDDLGWAAVDQGLQQLALSQAGVAAVFISGYCFVDPRSERAATVRRALQWARQSGILTILDLVPHDFLRSVGALKDIHRTIGRVDVLVAELSTGLELLHMPSPVDNVSDTSLTLVAQRLAPYSSTAAIVQHRRSATRYAQAMSINDGTPCSVEDFEISIGPVPTGFGDRMLAGRLSQLLAVPRIESGG